MKYLIKYSIIFVIWAIFGILLFLWDFRLLTWGQVQNAYEDRDSDDNYICIY